MCHNRIKSNRDTTYSKRWVDGDFVEGGLCTFISWEERNKIKRYTMNTKKEFEHERNDKEKYM